ncbi:FAD-dependent monooxygenase [Nocardioides sp. NPDC006303]|uniref:FAD-dependent monooxygenase n=1 Tax=Nocardioides sp. NPDC006303 TaxID=3156747 RepID=UPI0033A39A92
MSYSENPVVVIGDGPVGQSAALLLARWGLPVIVVDARPARDMVGSKAICQQRDVLDIWDNLGGAGAQIAREGVTWTRATTFHQDHELFTIEFQDPGESPFPPFVNISQCRTEEILDEKIQADPRIEVRWGHEATGITQDDSGAVVTCVTESGEVRITASYVIACTGARSDRLRAQLGLTFDGSTFGDQFLICDIRTDLPGWGQERRFYFDPPWNPGRQVLIHPCPDSTFRIDWQVPERFDLAEAERSGSLDERIRQIIGDREYEVMWSSVYRFHSRVVNRMRVGRVLLAGDSAHLVSPFGARGLNSGVQDAENAAWKIAFVLHGWAPESLLDSYHDERHAAALENIDVTTATMNFLVPHTAEEQSHRRRVLEAARDDLTARAEVDSGRLAEPYWYSDSPLTTPSIDRPASGRPPRGTTPPCAPGVLIPDHKVHDSVDGCPDRLRRRLRDGMTLLCGEAVDIGQVREAVAASSAHVYVSGVDELDHDLGRALGLGAEEVWLVRPDAHIAACLTSATTEDVRAAVERTLGSAANALS